MRRANVPRIQVGLLGARVIAAIDQTLDPVLAGFPWSFLRSSFRSRLPVADSGEECSVGYSLPANGCQPNEPTIGPALPQRARPEILFPLFAPVTALKGVGSRIGAHIERLAGPQIVDLLWHLPTGIVDRRYSPNLVDLEPGRVATLELTVVEHHAPPVQNRRIPYRIDCRDETGEITLVYFHGRADYLGKALPVGDTRLVSGTAELYDGRLQMTHPDIVAKPDERDSVMRGPAGLSPHRGALTECPRESDRRRRRSRERSARMARSGTRYTTRMAPLARRPHVGPTSPANWRDSNLPRLRARGLPMTSCWRASWRSCWCVSHVRRQAGRPIEGNGSLRSRVLSALPFELTDSQKTAIDEIGADMAADHRMLRLLQGDVGSGKTVVALMAMLTAVEAGRQAALMAPTEILAQQHYATIAPLAAAAGVSCKLLTGRDKGKARAGILEGLADGAIPIVVGTHALFQGDIAFDDLAVAVVDEQHRFGVHQRLLLAEKGAAVDVLLMTATPIPRTLMLAAYGDLDESQLREKPAGRKPVTTTTASIDRLNDAVAGVQRQLESGGKVFWVCPLVEESETIDVAAATARHSALQQRFGDRVGLVHGKMSGNEKDAVMARFAGQDGPAIDVLVATTVIEVGVDVPDATVMVIEHAERFGLAQLHQLRGRIRARRSGGDLPAFVRPRDRRHRPGTPARVARHR